MNEYFADLGKSKKQSGKKRGKRSRPNVLGFFNSAPEDMNRTFEEIVIAKGYAVETYYISTDDGYVLKMFRIPGKLGESQEE